MAKAECRRCKGTGSYLTSEDLHRSAGIAPCYCEFYFCEPRPSPPPPKEPLPSPPPPKEPKR